MTDIQAGARVVIHIETTVEAVGDHEITLTDGTHITYQPGQLPITVIEPGWQPGDVADDGHGPLVRMVRDDGVHLWMRVDGGRTVWDDETSLHSLTLISRAGGERP